MEKEGRKMRNLLPPDGVFGNGPDNLEVPDAGIELAA